MFENGEFTINTNRFLGYDKDEYCDLITRANLAENLEPQKKRMAAYCRVATEQLEQLSSYEAQVNYYTNYISNHEDYELAGIYADLDRIR